MSPPEERPTSIRIKEMLGRSQAEAADRTWLMAQLGNPELEIRIQAAAALVATVGGVNLPELLLPAIAGAPKQALPTIAYLLGVATTESLVSGVYTTYAREQAYSDLKVPLRARLAWEAADRLAKLGQTGGDVDVRLSALGGLLGGPAPTPAYSAQAEQLFPQAGCEGQVYFLEAIARAGLCSLPIAAWTGPALAADTESLRLAALHVIERCRLTHFGAQVAALASQSKSEEERTAALGALNRIR